MNADAFWEAAPKLGVGATLLIAVGYFAYRYSLKRLEHEPTKDEVDSVKELAKGFSSEQKMAVAKAFIAQREDRARARLVMFVIAVILFTFLALIVILMSGSRTATETHNTSNLEAEASASAASPNPCSDFTLDVDPETGGVRFKSPNPNCKPGKLKTTFKDGKVETVEFTSGPGSTYLAQLTPKSAKLIRELALEDSSGVPLAVQAWTVPESAESAVPSLSADGAVELQARPAESLSDRELTLLIQLCQSPRDATCLRRATQELNRRKESPGFAPARPVPSR